MRFRISLSDFVPEADPVMKQEAVTQHHESGNPMNKDFVEMRSCKTLVGTVTGIQRGQALPGRKLTCLAQLAVVCMVAAVPADEPAQRPTAADLVGSDIDGAPLDFSPQGFFAGPIDIPDIARYMKLPHRMYFEPYITDAIRIRVLDERYPGHSARILNEAKDAEIQEVAAIQLFRFAREGLADISPASEALQQALDQSKSRRVRSACFRAAAAGGLRSFAQQILEFSETASDAERVILEVALRDWKYAPAAEMWKRRLNSSTSSATSLQLACQGLAALQDNSAADQMIKIAGDSRADYLRRMATAEAAAVLDPESSRNLAQRLISRTQQERILAVALLNSSQPASLQAVLPLCSDAENAVAAAAWEVIYERDNTLLMPLLEMGYSHNDKAVRITAAQVMRDFPDSQRVNWLHELISDFHIEVRNVARRMLFSVSETTPDLKPQIVGLCADALQANSKDWQGIEQSLVLLGQMRSSDFSALAVELLNYPRDEVMVSAAWLIHLFPDLAVRTPVLQATKDAETWLYEPAEFEREHGMKQAFLFEYLGIMRVKDIEEILLKQLGKTVPGVLERRSAAMWALGLLYENNPDAAMVKNMHGRIQDRNSPDPEKFPVRRFCLLALGMMRSTGSQDVVQEAWEVDSADEGLRGAARWIRPLVGMEMTEPIEPFLLQIGGWRLNPIDD